MFASRLTSLRARLAARLARSLVVAGIAAATFTTAACSADRVTEPTLSPTAAASKTSDAWDKYREKGEGNVLKVNGALQWAKQLDAPVVRTFAVTDRDGGKLEIKELGFKIEVPKNALDNSDSKVPLVITVTALPGKVVAYSFQPHGIRFLRPLEVDQELKATDWKGNKLNGIFTVGYFANDWQLDLAGNRILIDEFIPAYLRGDHLYFDISHFSGYMVSLD